MKKQTSKIDKFEPVRLPRPELVKGGNDSTSIIVIDESMG